MKRAVLLLLLLLSPASAPPARAEENAASARRREAQALADKADWDAAASVFLEIAMARPPGWEGDARNAQACAARSAAARGDTALARVAFELVLREDPEHPIARAGMVSLPPVPESEAPPARPSLPIPDPASAPSAVPEALPPPAEAGDAGALYQEALALAEQGRFLSARERLRQALRLDPGHARAWRLTAEVDEALVGQVERAFHRHDRPRPEPLPAEEKAFLRLSEQARRDGRLPGETALPPPGIKPAPPSEPKAPALAPPPGPLTPEPGLPPAKPVPPLPPSQAPDPEPSPAPEKGPGPASGILDFLFREALAEEESPDEAARRADLAHARAQAATLVKSESFDLAQAAYEAILAAHPEAKDLIAEDLKALARARKEAEARRAADARKAAETEAGQARAQADAEQAVREIRAGEQYAAALSLYERGDFPAAQAAFEALERLSPGYRETRAYLEGIPKAREKAEAEARARLKTGALEEARRQFEAGRLAEARKALEPLPPQDPDARDWLRRIAEAETERAKAEGRAQAEARLKARRDAVEAAVQRAREGDFRGARSRLYRLQEQEPRDPGIPAALRKVDELERKALPPASGSPSFLDQRRLEAEDRLGALALERACDRDAEAGRLLLEGGELEEARRRFLRVAELSPGTREVDRDLSRIDEAIRARGIEAALEAAWKDPRAARARLLEFRQQDPSLPEIQAALKRMDGIERRQAAGASETPKARTRRALALYKRSDLVPAGILLRELQAEREMGILERRRIEKALADIAERRARALAFLKDEAAQAEGGAPGR